MEMRPTEQIYVKMLRGSMRVMLVSRKNCSTYRNEAWTHKSSVLASEPASAAWGTPHYGLCGGRTSDIKASSSLSLEQRTDGMVARWVIISGYPRLNVFALFAAPGLRYGEYSMVNI
jgi:hypothetical protein